MSLLRVATAKACGDQRREKLAKPAKLTLPPWSEKRWMGRQRKKKAETKAERLERVAAEMRARRTAAQKSAAERWANARLSADEKRMTHEALGRFPRLVRDGEQGADIWPVGTRADGWGVDL